MVWCHEYSVVGENVPEVPGLVLGEAYLVVVVAVVMWSGRRAVQAVWTGVWQLSTLRHLHRLLWTTSKSDGDAELTTGGHLMRLSRYANCLQWGSWCSWPPWSSRPRAGRVGRRLGARGVAPSGGSGDCQRLPSSH
jgi:hypothetical protein